MAPDVILAELLKLAVDALYLLVIIDERGIIRHVSEPYAKILGMDADDIIGHHVESRIPNTRLPQVVKTGRSEMGQLFVMKNDVITVCNRFPIWDKEGNIRGALSTATFQDVDNVSKVNDELIRLRRENKAYKQKLKSLKWKNFSIDSIIGQAPSIKKLKDTIEKTAFSTLPVLISGETGTGKEVFANAVHALSGRAVENFVKINCAAIPADLLEAELFGYVGGAFSGAAKSGRIGKLEFADKGTVLLDEIGEMPLTLQTKLLRVLQEREFEKVGSNETVKLNVRIIACTNQDIGAMAAQGTFRRDLYYRLNVVELHIPPLRERIADLPLFCDYFIQKINRYHGCSISGLTEEALERFSQYPWPGNIRELEHVLERACITSSVGRLTLEHFDFFTPRIEMKQNGSSAFSHHDRMNPVSLSDHKKQAERNAILRALEETHGNRSKAAKLLNITRSRLYEKLKEYSIT